MNALRIIGSALGGGFVGACIGLWMGEREGGDYNFAPVIYAPIGGIIGGAAGVVLGSVLWAN